MAALYRMVPSKHTCPFGIRAKQMLEAAGFTIDDRLLQLRKEVDVFNAEQGVATTRQMFIDGEVQRDVAGIRADDGVDVAVKAAAGLLGQFAEGAGAEVRE
ncbi:hypothetical protein [Sphingomonas sp. SAFR-052]|uniref:hypothetical protein n=1 Tax=Sphingomonas sp. SAFR-052 TaxID=3436867 RepID=UPI003F7D8480